MCSPLTSPTGTFAPTQTGKSRGDLVHKGLGAPGALLCSTTKPDLLEFAALARTRRRMAGPVLVFDATGTTRWPAQLRWSPISGCDDWRSAYQRAHTMVEAAAVHLTEGNSGNDRVFRERATMVVAAYLLAAALYDRGVGVLVRWSIGKPPSTEPADLLEPRYPQLARNLRAEIGMVAQTSDAVWLSVRRVIEPFLDPTSARAVLAAARARLRRPHPHRPGREPVPHRRPAPGRARRADPDRTGRTLADHRAADGPGVPEPTARPARHRGARRTV